MRNQNRRRNPDMEAYRDWQSDSSDRGALQRYLLSMDRGRELLDDPERIVELDQAIGQDEALRPIYNRVRPDYSSEATPFREERWRTLVDRYAGRHLDPRAALILVEMGLRSGVPMDDVYQILYDNNIISGYLNEISYGFQNDEIWDEDNNSYFRFDSIGPDMAPIVPVLIHCVENDSNIYESIVVLGKIGPIAASAVPILTQCIQDDKRVSVRYACAEALGKIGSNAASSLCVLENHLNNDVEDLVKSACYKAIQKIKEG